jgi:Trk-type K+ transport system membrane component
MIQILIRFVIGGLVVSAFALIGDLLKPKSFAGLFGAAPSVALATLGLTVAKEGATYAATEARSMMAGAIAFFVYASLVSWIMMRRKPKALWVTIGSMPIWLLVAFGLWYVLVP